MKIPAAINEVIVNAKSKALATVGTHGVNVVPVSLVRVNDNSIWLFNFFMEKTIENLNDDSQVGLACWSGMEGVQIKAEVDYVTSGERFDEAVAWVEEVAPDRTVRGLLVLTPNQICDISPGGIFCAEDLDLND